MSFNVIRHLFQNQFCKTVRNIFKPSKQGRHFEQFHGTFCYCWLSTLSDQTMHFIYRGGRKVWCWIYRLYSYHHTGIEAKKLCHIDMETRNVFCTVEHHEIWTVLSRCPRQSLFKTHQVSMIVNPRYVMDILIRKLHETNSEKPRFLRDFQYDILLSCNFWQFDWKLPFPCKNFVSSRLFGLAQCWIEKC